MSQIGGFTTLLITIPSTPAYPKATTHTIYLRPNTPKVPTENDPRSLFLANVPIDSTSAHLRAIFTSLIGTGRFESVTFEHEKKNTTSTPTLAITGAAATDKKRKRGDDTTREAGAGARAGDLPPIWDRELRRSGSTAVVVLVDERSVEVALKAARKLGRSLMKKGKGQEAQGEGCVWGANLPLTTGDESNQDNNTAVPPLGSARYAAHQRLKYPSKQILQTNVDAYMTAFKALEDRHAQAAKRARNVPDDDGFVTVVRGGGSRTGPARMEDAEQKREELERKEREKRDGMGDFYRFQLRERRKVEQGELVRRFEEDRRRVEGMRERGKGKGARGFRPEV